LCVQQPSDAALLQQRDLTLQQLLLLRWSLQAL
jgi:hypothetical protein